MPDFYYLSGALGSPRLLDQHQDAVQQLLSGTYTQYNLEMLKGHHNVYSLRISHGERLIFTTIEAAGAHHLLLLDYLPHHEYHRCKYLNPQILANYVEKQKDLAEQSAAVEMEEELQFEPITKDDGERLMQRLNHADPQEQSSPKPAYYYKSNLIFLNPAQETALTLTLPAIVNGVAGSGKSCVALAALAKAALSRGDDKPIWYITQSQLLVEEMKEQWEMAKFETPPPIEFMTYNQCLERLKGPNLGPFVGQETFNTWYTTIHLRKQKSIDKLSPSPKPKYPNATCAYQEFRICASYTQEDYLNLGDRESRIKKDDKELRIFIYEAFEAYKRYLTFEKKIDSSFYNPEIEEEAGCSFLVVDEAQDFSTLALSTLHNIAKGQVLYCVDGHQCLEGVIPVGHFLKKRFAIHENSCIELRANYRCPVKVISAANAVLELKHLVSGGKIDKHALPCVSGIGENNKVLGALYQMDQQALLDNQLIKELAQTPQFAIITTPERVQELKDLFNTPLVFTPKSIKGLEYEVILTIGLYDNPLLEQMSGRLPKSQDKISTNRPKPDKEDNQFTIPLNEIYIAYTRATEVLIISETATHQNTPFFQRLKDLFNQDTFSRDSFKETTSPGTWLEQVELQIKVGNHQLAEELYLSKINPEKAAFQQWLTMRNSPRPTSPKQHKKPEAKNSQATSSYAAAVPVEQNESSHTPSQVKPRKPSKNQSSPKNVPTSSPPTTEQTQAQRLYDAFESKSDKLDDAFSRLAVALKVLDTQKFLFDKIIQTKQGTKISLIHYIEQEEGRKNALLQCLAKDWVSLSKVTTFLFQSKNKNKYKKEFIAETLKPLVELVRTVEGFPRQPKNMFITSAKNIPLLIAAALNKMSVFRTLQTMGADINQAATEGCTPLLIAVQNGDLEIVKALIENKADVNKADNNGCTPLLFAVEKGHAAIVNALIAKGADVNQANIMGHTPLIIATQNGHLAIVNALIAKGADVNQADNKGCAPLLIAAINGHVEIVNALLAKGADVNQADNKGCTPLIIAAQNGHVEIVNALLAKGANVNQADNNACAPLFFAVQKGHVAIVNALIAKGADVNQANIMGFTPLFIAAKNGHAAIVTALIAKGANVNQADNKGCTPLIIAAQNGHVTTVTALIAKGADVNQADNNGHTPLLVAAQNGDLEIVKALIANKADLNKANNNGCTPLIIAAQNGHVATVTALIAKGADVNKADNNGITPLNSAAYSGHTDVAVALIHSGADLNKAANDGCTPLFVAAQKGHVEIVNALLAKGADINQASNDGSRPIYAAAFNGHEETLTALIDMGADIQKGIISTRQNLMDFAEDEGDEVKANMARKIKEALAQNNNDENRIELSPFDIAQIMGHTKIVEILTRETVRLSSSKKPSSHGFFTSKVDGKPNDTGSGKLSALEQKQTT